MLCCFSIPSREAQKIESRESFQPPKSYNDSVARNKHNDHEGDLNDRLLQFASETPTGVNGREQLNELDIEGLRSNNTNPDFSGKGSNVPENLTFGKKNILADSKSIREHLKQSQPKRSAIKPSSVAFCDTKTKILDAKTTSHSPEQNSVLDPQHNGGMNSPSHALSPDSFLSSFDSSNPLHLHREAVDDRRLRSISDSNPHSSSPKDIDHIPILPTRNGLLDRSLRDDVTPSLNALVDETNMTKTSRSNDNEFNNLNNVATNTNMIPSHDNSSKVYNNYNASVMLSNKGMALSQGNANGFKNDIGSQTQNPITNLRNMSRVASSPLMVDIADGSTVIIGSNSTLFDRMNFRNVPESSFLDRPSLKSNFPPGMNRAELQAHSLNTPPRFGSNSIGFPVSRVDSESNISVSRAHSLGLKPYSGSYFTPNTLSIPRVSLDSDSHRNSGGLFLLPDPALFSLSHDEVNSLHDRDFSIGNLSCHAKADVNGFSLTTPAATAAAPTTPAARSSSAVHTPSYTRTEIARERNASSLTSMTMMMMTSPSRDGSQRSVHSVSLSHVPGEASRTVGLDRSLGGVFGNSEGWSLTSAGLPLSHPRSTAVGGGSSHSVSLRPEGSVRSGFSRTSRKSDSSINGNLAQSVINMMHSLTDMRHHSNVLPKAFDTSNDNNDNSGNNDSNDGNHNRHNNDSNHNNDSGHDWNTRGQVSTSSNSGHHSRRRRTFSHGMLLQSFPTAAASGSANGNATTTTTTAT
eukprot:CAMPEP_0175040444 /NCGR_PEP_ID=MMETSP0052_2-20121109/1264_1 /TAXON_ID=51329 ORGANISM="Polytomella parva, Strain SAG 63-3" /NCGR_SAMPLE_ID=MMETSP0052_2 /ASSEMBLY_ACC=CAM_ASM_000194 /LENGTH=747 /DNA_ID=CAMNT_0016302651 /DNA_START=36 /DNA_END=2276 /DNA_ORIENTATION=+